MEEFVYVYASPCSTQITRRLIKNKHPPPLARTNKAADHRELRWCVSAETDEGLLLTIQSTFKPLRDEATENSAWRSTTLIVRCAFVVRKCVPKWKNRIYVYFWD